MIFRALSVENKVYPSKTSLCLAENVLSKRSDKLVAHKGLDFEKWISILKEECGYIPKKQFLHYKYDGRALAIENDQNCKAAISLMHNHGDVLNFEMSNRSNGKQDYSDLLSHVKIHLLVVNRYQNTKE